MKKIVVTTKDKNKPKVRGSWGNIRPVTMVIPDKTKYTRKSKHKRDTSYD